MDISSSVFLLNPGDDNQIITSTIDHTLAAGIYQLHSDLVTAGYEAARLEIANNTLHHCQDYCIQVQETRAKDMKIHDNLIHTFYNGIRFGRIFEGKGPTYVYKNIIYSVPSPIGLGRGAAIEISAVTNPSISCWNGTTGYFYHNTLGDNDTAINAYGQNLAKYGVGEQCGEQWGYLAFRPRPLRQPELLEPQLGGGSPGTTQGWWTAPNVAAPDTRIWSTTETNLVLPAGHAAINLGVNLSTTWNAGPLGSSHPALPGMSTGYFIGAAPDAGAVEFGVMTVPETPSNLSGRVALGGRATVR